MKADARPDVLVSGSFSKLQRLGRSFGEAARDEALLLELAGSLGATALPLCLRHFAGDDEGAAGWAHALLAHIGRDSILRGRIVAAIEAAACRSSDPVKLRAIALLAELGAGEPEAGGAEPRPAREIALCLDTPAEVARAGDDLIDQLSTEEMLELFDHLVEAEPGSALVLLDELLVHDELDEDARHELRQRRAAARQFAPAPLRARRRPRGTQTCRAAVHADGRRVLLVSDRRPGRPPGHRALCVLVSPGGILLDGHYGEDMTAPAIDDELVAPLERAGFDFAPVALETARGFLIEAARLAVQSGRTLPRPFYLGRHLLGLADEHLHGTPRSRAAVDLGALLDRAIQLVASDEPVQAIPLLQRYIEAVPDDAEGHAQLGLCHLRLDDASGALAHLGRATWLAPDEPLHHWNAAAAAHRAGQPGACYLALEAYGKTRDVAPGADQRRRIADAFAAEYARFAALEHPGASPLAVASAEARPRRRQRRR